MRPRLPPQIRTSYARADYTHLSSISAASRIYSHRRGWPRLAVQQRVINNIKIFRSFHELSHKVAFYLQRKLGKIENLVHDRDLLKGGQGDNGWPPLASDILHASSSTYQQQEEVYDALLEEAAKMLPVYGTFAIIPRSINRVSC